MKPHSLGVKSLKKLHVIITISELILIAKKEI